MFVITLGPIGKRWGRWLKIAGIGIVLLVVVLVVWRLTQAVPNDSTDSVDPVVIRQTMSTLGHKLEGSFWQRIFHSMQVWLQDGI